MTPLDGLIRRLIEREGPMSVARYMALALQHPEHGYYRRGTPVGASGDFVTAPEVGQVFGELIGLWCADLWDRMGRPDPTHFAELGPGRGTLMADALRAIRQAMPGFADAVHLHLVDSSETLRAEQAERLGDARPVWHDSLSSVPDGPALVVANEFFDALPIRQFVRQGEKTLERVVALDPESDGFAFAAAEPADPAGAAIVRRLAATHEPLPEGAILEVSPAREALAGEIGQRVAAAGGGALVVDYGAAALDGADTLQAVRGHARTDPLADPGAADLTSHVDFGSLRAAAEAKGAAVYGPVPQGDFLARLGIAARLEQLTANADPKTAEELHAGCARLTAPDAMGRLFQALAIVHPELGTPVGFET